MVLRITDGRSLDDKRDELRDKEGKRDYGDLHKITAAYKQRLKKAMTVPPNILPT